MHRIDETGQRRREVLVTRAGVVSLDGKRIAEGPGDTHQEVILNALQQDAASCGRPVEALVLDRHGHYAVAIEVSPDGASRLITEY